ncbi:MAG: hypothetical protein WBH03_21365 [Cyclobacteriaceae bacterium]
MALADFPYAFNPTVVLDSTGAPAPGVEVTLRDAPDGQALTVGDPNGVEIASLVTNEWGILPAHRSSAAIAFVDGGAGVAMYEPSVQLLEALPAAELARQAAESAEAEASSAATSASQSATSAGSAADAAAASAQAAADASSGAVADGSITNAKYADESITFNKINPALLNPDGSSAGLRSLGTAATQAAPGDDARFEAINAATQTELDGKADLVGGVVPTGQIPAIALGEVFPVASEAEMLALTAQTGDIAIRSDLPGSFVLNGDPSVLGNWTQLSAGGDVTSVNGQTGVIVLGKGDVGLDQVTNTSDQNKPVSAAQQAALNGKIGTSTTGLTIETGTSLPPAGIPGRIFIVVPS